MFGEHLNLFSGGSKSFYDYTIDYSARLASDARFSIQPPSGSNASKYTFSTWIKLTNDNTSAWHLFGRYVSGFELMDVKINATTVGMYTEKPTGYKNAWTGNRVLRDHAGWYHIVVQVDFTLASANDRFRFFVNGEEIYTPVTLNQSGGTGQNWAGYVNNSSYAYYLFWNNYYSSNSQIVADTYMIDGQAVAPTAFAEEKLGVWVPIEYTGTYGVGGYHLTYSNSANLGQDSSGNGNNLTVGNIASTDQLLDTPTNNFCTLNPIDYGRTETTGNYLSEGNLRHLPPGSGNWAGYAGTIGFNSGKWYWEVQQTNSDLYLQVGTIREGGNASTTEYTTGTCRFRANGQKITSAGYSAYSSSTVNGDIIGIAVDKDAGTVVFYKNNVSMGSISCDINTVDTIKPHSWTANGARTITNFGQDSSFAGTKTPQGYTDANGCGDFYYEPPTGYLALCSANMPEPAISPLNDESPADYFTPKIFTGDGTSSRALSVGFAPDLAWFKSRDSAHGYSLFDSVRGTQKQLNTNNTDAEYTHTTNDGVQSFDTDGVTIGYTNSATTNYPSKSYASWFWKAGGTSVSNTDGTITSNVSANTTSGFSIVSYTGNGTSGSTVGHGLSKCDLAIIKSRSAATNWDIINNVSGIASTSSSNQVRFDANGFFSGNGGEYPYMQYSDRIALGYDSWANANGGNFIAYCFHSVEGFSKIGSYIGNGSSTDGPFVYCGFKPAFVIYKSTGAVGWEIMDNKRDTDNPAQHLLYPNSTAAEGVGTGTTEYLDFLSNGFKIRSNSGVWNTSGTTYLYMAFAENPFKYANAR